jgi:hypothetical protein
MSDVRLVAPRVLVIRDGEEPLEIQTDNRDLVGWEQTRVRHKWPKFDEAPFKWLTYLSWSAARRTGALNGLTYESWEASVLSVRDLSSEVAEDDEMGRPTPPGPEPG